MITVGVATTTVFQGRLTANQTLTTAATYYVVAFDTEDYDDASAHSTTSPRGRYVAQKAGLYRLTGNIVWVSSQATTGGTTNRIARFQKNGVAIPGTWVYATYTGILTQTLPTTLVTLAAGDYVDMAATAALANAGIYGTSDGGCMFTVEFVR